MKTRALPGLTLAAFLLLALGGCGVQLHNGYKIVLKNLGRDPIHVGGERCPQNEVTHIGYVGGEYEAFANYPLTRNDINLGTLEVRAVGSTTGKSEVVITMTEPVYFDFRFESADTARVIAEFRAP
jgi:hypothetical protein